MEKTLPFAPKSGGEVPPYAFTPLEPISKKIGSVAIREVVAMARDFWDMVASDPRISPELEAFLNAGNPTDRM